jgi:hypothetical protein
MAASCSPAPSRQPIPRGLVLKWSAFLATAERGTYFATYRGSFVGPEPALQNSDTLGRLTVQPVRGLAASLQLGIDQP